MSSCKKDQSVLSETKNESSSKILTFKSIDEYTRTLKEVLAYNNVERKAWEESQGFESMGIKSEEFYNTINPESFKSKEEIINFVRKNSDFLQLVTDSDGEVSVETKLFANPNRYFSNVDGVFQIGSEVYKVLEKGLVYGGIDQIEKLKTINETNFFDFKSDRKIKYSNSEYTKSILSTEDYEHNCGVEMHDTKTKNVDRTYMQINLQEFEPACCPVTTLYVSYIVKPQKKSIFWFNCTRTIFADIRVRIDHFAWGGIYAGQWLNEKYSKYEPGKLDSKIEGVFLNIDQSANFGPVSHISHFGGYWCVGSTPSAPPVTFSCNSELAY